MKKLAVLFLLPMLLGFKFVPLFSDLTDIPELSRVVLKKHYKVTSLFNDDLSKLGVKNSIAAWNRAANDPNFMVWVDDGWTETVDIYVIPELLGWAGAVAHPLSKQVCQIDLGLRFEYNRGIIIHEIGHCLGFAHNLDPKSTMNPGSAAGGVDNILDMTEVDKNTAKTLQKLLQDLKD